VPNPVLIADLEARFRPLTVAEQAVAQALLDDAWAELLARIPDLEARVADGRVTDGLVVRVVSAMVIRVLRNPEAIRQWSVDDASFTRDNLVSSGLLYASAEEVGLLVGAPLGPVGHVSFSAPYGSRW
jgi:hypothetical protein